MPRRKHGRANPRGKAYGFRGLRPAQSGSGSSTTTGTQGTTQGTTTAPPSGQ